ncbi:MAG: hypothetical protein A3D65_02800 [Candidatus Lloydbacteria bacterium RIFCSPHIGHO2_02_FULL_50_13]|uniref:Uncharacterized protein n=1 Tax=Candidatus Lloydbacteria bacterium RIFCSPHIGHO2_02_FULL_50_13 TaxID=1798661 RepID=A0A1G2D3P8_9BACT|nr:MAG: hypothetical protein A3D65_02800 [Candidatus Lloydbacteria bacterium RIFCSPHIGHO2_02_FULL_50_13]
MSNHLKRTIIVFLTFVVIAFAILGVLYVFDFITAPDLRDYMEKIGTAAVIVALASIGISFLLSVNKQP